MNDIYIEEKKNASVRRNIKAYAFNTHTKKKLQGMYPFPWLS